MFEQAGDLTAASSWPASQGRPAHPVRRASRGVIRAGAHDHPAPMIIATWATCGVRSAGKANERYAVGCNSQPHSGPLALPMHLPPGVRFRQLFVYRHVDPDNHSAACNCLTPGVLPGWESSEACGLVNTKFGLATQPPDMLRRCLVGFFLPLLLHTRRSAYRARSRGPVPFPPSGAVAWPRHSLRVLRCPFPRLCAIAFDRHGVEYAVARYLGRRVARPSYGWWSRPSGWRRLLRLVNGSFGPDLT